MSTTMGRTQSETQRLVLKVSDERNPRRQGKYLPPFKCLTPGQEKDVDKLITRLVSQQEAHIALMELMKWRIEGLDPVYAQAVQLKQRDPISVRLIFLHAMSCGFKWNWSFLKWAKSRSGMEKAQKLIFIVAHSRVERRDFSNDDEKDADFFAFANGMINEVLFDASSP
ncbi:unnamed protein product [Lactuca saligna]|uniref:Uncharacterized protein n=1 Tax=Lactuca saligna TaxID=75948 RepID=A0AA35UZH2_LACSI|nr:unnamed protein product [Lactuca saligna]